MGYKNPNYQKEYQKQYRQLKTEYQREWRKLHPGWQEVHNKNWQLKFEKENGIKYCQTPKQKQYNKDARLNRKKLVIEHYGNKCDRCGNNDIRVLSIDHIKGGGTQHLKSLKGKKQFYSWIIENNFPNNLQCLCMNCQFIKRVENNECSQKPKKKYIHTTTEKK